MALNDPPRQTGAPAGTDVPADANAPNAGAPELSQQRLAQQLTRTANQYGMFHPRWQLLAAMLFMPMAIAGYAIKLYFLSNQCTVSPLCSIDMLPGAIQVIVIWLLFLLVCFIVSLVARHLETEPEVQLGDLSVAFKYLSNYLGVAPLLVVYAAVGVLELLVTLWRNVLDPAAIALVSILALVATRAILPPRTPARQASQHVRRAAAIGSAATTSYRLRTRPLLRRFLQPRAAQQARGAVTPSGTPTPSDPLNGAGGQNAATNATNATNATSTASATTIFTP